MVLNTKEGGNFYFTPLGKSYVCEDGEDQGPLKLYNQVGANGAEAGARVYLWVHQNV